MWGDEQPPPAIRLLLSGFATRAGLASVDFEHGTAYRSPDSLEVGWSNLAASHAFRTAMVDLDESASFHVFLDLEQLVELALQQPDMPSWMGERAARGLGLRGLRCAMFSVRREGGEWLADGTIATTGRRFGVPGLLTRQTTRQAAVARDLDPGLDWQVDAFVEPWIARRIVTSLTTSSGPSLFAGFADGMGRLVDRLADSLGGRLAMVGAEGDIAGAVAVVDQEELEEALDDLPPGMLEAVSVDVRDGWLLLQTAEELACAPPDGGRTRRGPFVRARARTPLGWLAVELGRASADRVHVSLRLE